jgi:hypothetical protein
MQNGIYYLLEEVKMKILMQILVVILQLAIGSMLGFVSAIVLGIGNGWELLVFVIGYSLGVWGVGTLAARMLNVFPAGNLWLRLVVTLICSGLGVLVLWVTPPAGFIKALYPLIGAVVGYYLPALFSGRQPANQA